MSPLVARGLGVSGQELADSFRIAVPDDLDEVLALRKAALGYTPTWDDRRYMQWRYALESGSTSWATYRILRLRGEVIAAIGAEEFLLQSSAGIYPAACLMDILALERFRGLGLGVWLNFTLFNAYPLVFALSSNSNSMSTVRALYAPLESRRELQIPLNARDYMRRRLKIPLISGIAGVAASGMLRWRARHLHRARQPVQGELREIVRFAADTNLMRRKPMPEGVVEIVRSAAYLNWRYFDDPRARYQAWGWFHGAELRSYVVVGCTHDAAGQRIPCITDWWMADEDDQAPFHALVDHVLHEAIASNSLMVKASACGNKLHQQLRDAGFSRELAGGLAAGWRLRNGETQSFVPRDGQVCFTGLGEDTDVLG